MPSIQSNLPSFQALPQGVQKIIRDSAEAGEVVSADKLIEAIAEDGMGSDAEKLLIEYLESSADGIVPFEDADFDSSGLGFENVDSNSLKGKIKRRSAVIQRLEKSNTRTMGMRAKNFRNIESLADLKRVLEADQKIAGVNEDQNTLYKTGNIAGKILLQDAVLLQRSGLLNADQKAQLAQWVNQVDQGNGIDALERVDVEAIDQMVEDVLQELGDQEILEVNDYALQNLDDLGSIAHRVERVEQNIPALEEHSIAARYDLSNALQETGLSEYQLKNFRTEHPNWANHDVELGRSFYRISQSIDEVSQNIELIENNAQPTLEARVEEVDQEILEQVRDLKPEWSERSDEDILTEVGADPIWQDALGEPFKEKAHLMNEMLGLQNELMALHASRVDGLKNLSSLRTIFSEKESRVASVNLMQSRLASASGSMVDLERQIADISIQEGAAREGLTQIAEVLAKFTGPEGKKQAEKLVEQLGLRDINALQAQVSQIRDDMIGGMEDLLQVYEDSGTANDDATALIEKELETLKSLSNDDPGATLQKLHEVRQNLVIELKSSVPSTLALEEYHALTGLDKEVTHFANATHQTQTIGTVKQELIQEQLQEALNQKQNAAEKTTSMLSKFSDQVMAYDTHAGAEVQLLLGVGADVGVAEVFAGAGVTGSIYVGKKFGMAPAYRAMADLDFTAKVKAKIPHIVEFEAEYRQTIASAGVAFSSMDEAKDFLNDYASMVSTKAKLELLKLDPISDRKAQISALEKEYGQLKSKVDKNIREHSCSNDRQQLSAMAKVTGAEKLMHKMGLHGAPKLQFQGEQNTFSFREDGQDKQVQDNSWSVKGEVNHYSFKFFNQDSAELDKAGEPTGHHKTRQGFHIGIPPKQVASLLRAGKKLPEDMVQTLANKMLDALPPGAGLEATMVMALIQKKWGEFTSAQAANLTRLQNSMGLGHGHAHAEFLVGLDWVMKDDKLQYVALEAGYEKEFEKDFGGQIGATAFRVEGQFKFDTEIALMHKIYKSDSYKAGAVSEKLKEKLPDKSPLEQLRYLLENPEKAAEIGVDSYLNSAYEALGESDPDLAEFDNAELLDAIEVDPSLAEGNLIGYLLKGGKK